jgi:general secretion pathway protein E
MDQGTSVERSPAAELLVAEGKLRRADLDRAYLVNNHGAHGIGPVLVRLGLVSDKDLAGAYSAAHGLPLLADEDVPEISLILSDISVKFLKHARVFPIGDNGECVKVAVVDPEDDFSVRAMETALARPLSLHVATESQMERALEQLYGDGSTSIARIADELTTPDGAGEADSIERLRDLAAEAPVVRLVNLIVNRALERRASDIHIEPFEDQLKVRYRIDGILQEVEAPPSRSTAAVVSRIKIMANMNIAERRLPQDGRIQLRTQGKMVDFRVSTVPTLYGESVVLRILDKEQVALDLGSLGFDPGVEARIREVLALPHGIMLVTGPTGSGKTTTLYAALHRINSSERKIITVEDPVEYQLVGVNQIQVKPQIGLNFADALRSIVRQDPDVIMIGEMRDLETARIAVQSALTGHLVFSTLHTNDAGSSVTRLLDMGVEDYLLTSTLNGILAQRLVRTLCLECRQPFQAPVPLVEELGLDRFTRSSEITLYKAVGCDTCANTGYRGRMVIAEFLLLGEPIRQLILAHADGTAIQQAAVDAGMDTMKTDGLRKALHGVTTVEEVTRVTQEA